MSDVNTFIDAIGQDVSATVAPRIESLAQEFRDKALNDYVPKVSTFANQLVKAIVDEQSAHLRDFTTALLKDLFQRYRPELTGELHARIIQGAVELTGHNIKIDVTRRDTGAAVSSLDIPVSLRINVNPLAVTVQNATLKLDVV